MYPCNHSPCVKFVKNVQIEAGCLDDLDGTEPFDLSGDTLSDAFEEHFVPVIRKYQIATECYPGSYLFSAANASNTTEVSIT